MSITQINQSYHEFAQFPELQDLYNGFQRQLTNAFEALSKLTTEYIDKKIPLPPELRILEKMFISANSSNYKRLARSGCFFPLEESHVESLADLNKSEILIWLLAKAKNPWKGTHQLEVSNEEAENKLKISRSSAKRARDRLNDGFLDNQVINPGEQRGRKVKKRRNKGKVVNLRAVPDLEKTLSVPPVTSAIPEVYEPEEILPLIEKFQEEFQEAEFFERVLIEPVEDEFIIRPERPESGIESAASILKNQYAWLKDYSPSQADLDGAVELIEEPQPIMVEVDEKTYEDEWGNIDMGDFKQTNFDYSVDIKYEYNGESVSCDLSLAECSVFINESLAQGFEKVDLWGNHEPYLDKAAELGFKENPRFPTKMTTTEEYNRLNHNPDGKDLSDKDMQMCFDEFVSREPYRPIYIETVDDEQEGSTPNLNPWHPGRFTHGFLSDKRLVREPIEKTEKSKDKGNSKPKSKPSTKGFGK